MYLTRDDEGPSRSRLSFVGDERAGYWDIEVRSPDNGGVGSVRLGSLIVRGEMSGKLTLAIEEEADFWDGDEDGFDGWGL